MNKKLAELLGIMTGDGCLSRYARSRMIYIAGHKTDDIEYHDTVTRVLFKEVFNKEIKIEEKKKQHAIFIRFYR